MTRTEAIFDLIKELPELELVDLLEKIHEHACAGDMSHIFTPFYDDTYEVEELKNEVMIANQTIKDLDFDVQIWKGLYEDLQEKIKSLVL